MVVIELFYQTVKEEEANFPMFEFLGKVLVELDRRDKQLIHVFLHYLVHLSKYLGFFPDDLVEHPEQHIHFDMRNGVLQNAMLPDPGASLVLAFARAELEDCFQIEVTQGGKSNLIAAMMEYYRTHVEGFKIPGSMAVFQEIFGG